MRAAPTISVITVAFRNLDGLKRMSDSLLAQIGIDASDIEHIVIDGGSDDGTRQWLESAYRAPYLIRWVSERDGGIFDAMNKGAAMATGDLIVFVSAGDALGSVSTLHSVAQRWCSGDWEWAYGGIRFVDAAGAWLGYFLPRYHDQRRLELGFTYAPHPCTYYSREFFHRLGGFDLEFGAMSDQEFAMRAGRATVPAFWIDFLCNFLVGGVSDRPPFLVRENLYHRARKKNRLMLRQSTAVDRVFVFAMAIRRWFQEKRWS